MSDEKCDAEQYFGSRHEDDGAVTFRCQRPAGHSAPHRDRSANQSQYDYADNYEWWPQSWWDDPTSDDSQGGARR